MNKYLHFILSNGTEHIFPLQSLSYVRSVPTINGKFDVFIVYKESSDHGYQIIVTLSASGKDRFMDKFRDALRLLETSDTTLFKFILAIGEEDERNSTH